MSISTLEFIARVGKRIEPDAPLSPEQAEAVEKLLNAALQRLGQTVSDDADQKVRALLQKSFSLTLSGGEIALDSTMVPTGLGDAYVSLSGVTEPLQYLPYYQDVLNPPNLSDYTYYTVSHNKFVVRDYTGAVPSATSLTVNNANYIPAISQVPDALIDDLIDIGVDLYMESLNPSDVEEEAHSAKSPS